MMLWATGGLLGLALLVAAGTVVSRPVPAPDTARAMDVPVNPVIPVDPVVPLDPVPSAGTDICPAGSDLCADPDAAVCDTADGTCDT